MEDKYKLALSASNIFYATSWLEQATLQKKGSVCPARSLVWRDSGSHPILEIGSSNSLTMT
jgi:hypothetical protein